MSEHGFPGGIPLLGAGWLRVTELYAMPTDGCGHRLAWLSLTPIAVRSGRINRSRFGSVLPQTIKDFAGLISYIRPKLLGDSGPHLFAATGDRSFIDGSLLPASERSRRMLRRSSTRIFALVIYIPCRSPEPTPRPRSPSPTISTEECARTISTRISLFVPSGSGRTGGAEPTD